MPARIRFFDLENGMRVYCRPEYGTNISGIGVRCGSANDPPGKRGLAHLAEHVLARRSLKHSPQEVDFIIQKYMLGLGRSGKMRIETWRDATFFGHDSLSNRKHLYICFDMAARMVRDKVFDETDICVEKAAVHQESFLGGIDIEELFFEAAYEGVPAARNTQDIPEELRALTLKDVRAFVEVHYRPRNMFAVVLGPSVREARRLAENYFADLPDDAAPQGGDKPHYCSPLLSRKSKMIVMPHLKNYHCALGFLSGGYLSADDAALDAIGAILEHRLYWKLREENRDFDKGVYSVECRTPRYAFGGLLYLNFATTCESFLQESCETIFRECERLKKEPIAEREAEMLRVNLMADHAGDLDGGALDTIIASAARGDNDLNHIYSYRNRLRGLTRERLREVANKYLVADGCVRVVVGPKEVNF